MSASLTSAFRLHLPAVPASRVRVPSARTVEAADAAVRHQWESLLATAMSPAERDELNDVFGRAVR